MPDNDKTPLNKHHLHDKFFKKIYSDPRYAQDLLRLALFPEDYELFDIDKLIPSKEASIDPDTGTEKFCDLNFSVPFKKEPDSPVYFGVIFEHTTGNVLFLMVSLYLKAKSELESERYKKAAHSAQRALMVLS